MAGLSSSIRKAARGNWNVLIQGESGTGKGVAALSIHEGSKRADRPFVLVNCGAIPENLVESELFGCERGAFTGADRQKRGKFEAAHTGTIFLDEIGELSLASQARLLHVLQHKEIERLGGEGRRIPVDVRVIAATNRDLDQMVADGRFRQDLYFRLNVFGVRTPPLREHPEDIPVLARHAAARCAEQVDRPVSGISPEVIELFQRHSWPGNVRQLENVVQRAVAVGETAMVLLDDLPHDFRFAVTAPGSTKPATFHQVMDDTARQLCIAAFASSNGNYFEAAQLLGVHRSSFYRLMHKYGLENR